MQKQVSCGIIPIFEKNWQKYILIVKWRHNNWWLPKGHIEPGEDCLTTALREFEEETWIPSFFLEIDKNKIFEDSYWFVLNGEKIYKIVKYYLWILKDWFEKYIKPQEGEIYEVKLINIDEIEKYIKFKSILDIIGKIK